MPLGEAASLLVCVLRYSYNATAFWRRPCTRKSHRSKVIGWVWEERNMHRNWLLVIIVGLLIGLYSRTEAEVLCRDRSGALFVREACRKTELRFNATALGLVGPPGPKGEKGERGPRGQQGPEGDSSTSTPRKPEPTSAGDPQPRPPWGPVWLLFVTVGLVVFYTIETYRLRREAQTQTELQLRPFVIFEPTEGKGFCVRNIGNNTALNVKVRDFALSSSPPVLAAFPWPVPFLRQGQDQPVQGRRASVEGAGVAEDFFDIL